MIKKITSKETYIVRHPVLRSRKPIETCRFEGDDDLTTSHFGYFENNQLIGVASLFEAKAPFETSKKCYQLRGMAVLKEQQNKKIGNQLIKAIEKQINENNCLLWFNARINAVRFYQKNGFESIGDTIEVSGIGPHVVMFKVF